ncbi:hypothetical protein M9Y10_030635 [Tritrichomonas musculus]|uniref:Uncharacterized protein n=1 Tax=Tritrichomonas musculus TaxID=1915356 RepID=A0ABR2H2J7_9EUKA
MFQENERKGQQMREAKSQKHFFNGYKSKYQKNDVYVSPPIDDHLSDQRYQQMTLNIGNDSDKIISNNKEITQSNNIFSPYYTIYSHINDLQTSIQETNKCI